MTARERELVDSGEVFAVLPDAAATTLGPWRSPARAHDHRLSPRLPSAFTVGARSHVHTARHRVPAEVLPLAGPAASWAAEPGDELSRPAEAAEALQWFESVGARPPIDTAAERQPAGGLSFEVARVDLPGWRLASVERLATYLRAVPIGSNGEPAGPEFVTRGDGEYDPFVALVHPTTSEPLGVRWAFIGVDRRRPTFDGSRLEQVAGQALQLQPYWADLRFGWGQRYTCGLQLQVPSGVTSIRLVATVSTSISSRWFVRVGGRVGGWWLAGGPRGSALRAATSRVGGGA